MIINQIFRANFWALFLLFSGLTSAIVSNQLLALASDFRSNSEPDAEMSDLLRAPSGRSGSSLATSTKASIDGLSISLSRMSVRLHNGTLSPEDSIVRELSGATVGLPVIFDMSDRVLGDKVDDNGSDFESKARFASLASVAVSLDAERDRRVKRGRDYASVSVGCVADIESNIIDAGAIASAKKVRLAIGGSRTTDNLGRRFGGVSKTAEPIKIIARFTDVSMHHKSVGGAAGRAGADLKFSDRIIVRRRKPVAITIGVVASTVLVIPVVAAPVAPIASRARAVSL